MILEIYPLYRGSVEQHEYLNLKRDSPHHLLQQPPPVIIIFSKGILYLNIFILLILNFTYYVDVKIKIQCQGRNCKILGDNNLKTELGLTPCENCHYFF